MFGIGSVFGIGGRKAEPSMDGRYAIDLDVTKGGTGRPTIFGDDPEAVELARRYSGQLQHHVELTYNPQDIVTWDGKITKRVRAGLQAALRAQEGLKDGNKDSRKVQVQVRLTAGEAAKVHQLGWCLIDRFERGRGDVVQDKVFKKTDKVPEELKEWWEDEKVVAWLREILNVVAAALRQQGWTGKEEYGGR